MDVLSLFDGISCGRVALERAAINCSKYCASEIDPYAMSVTNKNYPDTIQLGNILNWRNWDIGEIDLIMGGSPCQGFSFAGKQLNFDDPRSKLFFEFVAIVNNYKPRYFLLENVRMKKEYQDVISESLGVEPICINSSLVSAQNRVRYYWTNIPNVSQPPNYKVCLGDILDTPLKITDKKDGLVFKGGLSTGLRLDNGKKLSRNYREGARIYGFEGKAATLTAQSKGGKGGYSGLYGDLNNHRSLTVTECERLQTLPTNYTRGISNTQRYKSIGNGWTVNVIAHILRGI